MSCVHRTALGLPRDAGIDEIKRAYRKLSLKHHPDRGGDRDAFEKIQTAYEYLSKNITTHESKTIKITLEEAYFGIKVRIGDRSLSVPAGIRTGTKIKCGDVIYRIEIKRHSVFKRANDDLLVSLGVDARDVLNRNSYTFVNINGEVIDIPLTIKTSNDIIPIIGKGMPNPETHRFGDLLISFIIKFTN